MTSAARDKNARTRPALPSELSETSSISSADCRKNETFHHVVENTVQARMLEHTRRDCLLRAVCWVLANAVKLRLARDACCIIVCSDKIGKRRSTHFQMKEKPTRSDERDTTNSCRQTVLECHSYLFRRSVLSTSTSKTTHRRSCCSFSRCRSYARLSISSSRVSRAASVSRWSWWKPSR